TVISVNEARKRAMVEKIREAMDDRVAGKRIAVFGVTFKPNTDDMRAAPALTIVPALIGAGAEVRVVDPEGRKEGEALLPGVTWVENEYDAVKEADALVVLTEWNQFRGLDLTRLAQSMRGKTLVDLRNIYRAEEAAAAGFAYTSVGRG
ncbi:MAG: UDP binding domain-containing protein, partial [Pseudomonadota bacterium]